MSLLVRIAADISPSMTDFKYWILVKLVSLLFNSWYLFSIIIYNTEVRNGGIKLFWWFRIQTVFNSQQEGQEGLSPTQFICQYREWGWSQIPENDIVVWGKKGRFLLLERCLKQKIHQISQGIRVSPQAFPQRTKNQES
jgi:hypothetical protein